MNIPAPLIRAILDYAARYKFHICMYVCIPQLLGDCPRQLLSALGDFCSSDPLINPRNPGTLDALYTAYCSQAMLFMLYTVHKSTASGNMLSSVIHNTAE